MQNRIFGQIFGIIVSGLMLSKQSSHVRSVIVCACVAFASRKLVNHPVLMVFLEENFTSYCFSFTYAPVLSIVCQQRYVYIYIYRSRLCLLRQLRSCIKSYMYFVRIAGGDSQRDDCTNGFMSIDRIHALMNLDRVQLNISVNSQALVPTSRYELYMQWQYLQLDIWSNLEWIQ